MRVAILIILLAFSISTKATTWAPVYPYIQKTENNAVQIHSVPYDIYHGPGVIGQTFVSHRGKLLYTIERYFATPFLTINNGQYLVEFDFSPYLSDRNLIEQPDGSMVLEPFKYEGEIVRIYKDGLIFKKIQFAEFHIDTSKLYKNSLLYFGWAYRAAKKDAEKLDIKMQKHPVFIEGEDLFFITVDDQLIDIHIPTGDIKIKPRARDILKERKDWKPTVFNRKYRKVKYPEQGQLPKLAGGTSVEDALAKYLNTKPADREKALIEVYVHTLLINEKGRCEVVSVSPSRRKDSKGIFSYPYDELLKNEIEKWIKEQVFQTKLIPRNFKKFKFTDFVFLE
jgi:hypothetical protein